MSGETLCPDCNQKTVGWRFTWRGILYAILCFPCGLWCCFRRRERHCSRCNCEIISYFGQGPVRAHGYRFRDYSSTKRVPSSFAYRNPALSVTSDQSNEASMTTYNSQSELIGIGSKHIHKEPIN